LFFGGERIICDKMVTGYQKKETTKEEEQKGLDDITKEEKAKELGRLQARDEWKRKKEEEK
jgi:hypothetical protein